MKNKREKGKQLEHFITDMLKPIDKYARPTKNSGASTEIEDVLSSLLYVQCKVNNKSNNINVLYKDWKKMINRMPINTKKFPIFVNQNKSKEVFITLGIDDFFNLLYKIYGG